LFIKVTLGGIIAVFFTVVHAQEATPVTETGTPGQTQSPFGMLPMLIIFFAIMYFLLIRPNQKREKQRREMLSALSKGDKVITTGGIYGTVVGLTDKTAVIRVNDESKTTMEFARGAVAQVISDSKD